MHHPVALGAVLVLVVNDHVLKAHVPGVITGKLSDVAGMVFFPLLLVTLLDPLFRGRWLLPFACLATGVAFALVKTTAVGHDAYVLVWGSLRWPLRALRAVVAGNALPSPGRVACVMDATDLLAIPFVGIAYRLGNTSPTRA